MGESESSVGLQCLEVGAARDDADLCVILMHGLGANGHDFEDVAGILAEAAGPKRWRFVLPHAPEMPVTVNMGMRMPAWYDIIDFSHPREVNWDTVVETQQRIEALIEAEPAKRLILAGFSQGAAMALHVGLRHQQRIAGVLMMSGYLLESDERPAPESQGSLPIALLHGSADDVVPIRAAERSVELLKAAGYDPRFKSYPGLGHSVNQEEVRDVLDWLLEHGS